jgi:GT2 family glycosyltransferase
MTSPRVAIVVLNYNTPHLTDPLASYLQTNLHYEQKDIYVVDNGSEKPPQSATHRLPENLGFTRGMYEAWRIASSTADYAAYWFLNSDVGFEYGDEVLSNLTDVLFSSDEFAQISPQFNSPHKFMEQANGPAQKVPYLEPTATLIKSSAIERLGFWDLDLTCGWGVDYDYGFRVREAGLASILTNRARIVHKEHQSIEDFSGYIERAASEMHTVLNRKYGPGWERIRRMRKVVPVILTCDRDHTLTSRFVESFRSVSATIEKPVVVIDTSASPKLTPEFLSMVQALDPGVVAIHPPQPNMSFYESVQDAADFALSTALEHGDEDSYYLFLEDDIVFSSRFSDRLGQVRWESEFGFLTFYLPGDGFGGDRSEAAYNHAIDPNHFYGTQCVLFPRNSIEKVVTGRSEMHAAFPPGYDIRWSRYLAAQGYPLYATERSYVQHLSTLSRLHGHGTHASRCFVP